MPAYATTASGAPEDVEPEQKKRRTRSGSLTSPEEPGQQISREEFQELVRDIDVDTEPSARRAAPPQRSARRPRRRPPLRRAGPPAPERDPTADLTPEDLVLKDDAKPRPKNKRPRNRRHGRSR